MKLLSFAKKSLKYFAIFLIITSISSYGLLTYLEIYYRNLADNRLEEIHDAGYVTTYEEIHERLPLLSAEENAATIYQEGFDLYVGVEEKETSLVPFYTKHDDIDSDQKYSKEVYAEAYVLLNKNQAALAKFYEGALLKNTVYIYDYSPGGELDISHLTSVRDATKLLCLDTEYAIFLGDIGKAEYALLAAMNLGYTLRNEYGLIAQIVRIACHQIVFVEFERLLNQGKLSHEFLNQIRLKNDKFDPVQLMSLGYQHDFIMIMNDFEKVWAAPEECIDVTKLEELIISLKFLAEKDRSKYIKLMHDSIKHLETPYDQYALNKKLSIQEFESTKSYEIVTKTMMSSMRRVQDMVWRSLSHHALIRTACSIELYRLDNHTPPETLQDLIPKYLSDIPLDPYGGQPLQYKATDMNYLVYSIGQDMEDDSGIRLESTKINYAEGDLSLKVNLDFSEKE